MASRILLSIFVLYLATHINADGSLRVGEFNENSKLLYHGNFDAMGFIFLKRTETFDIKLTDGGKIKAIDIQDLRGDSSSWILAGGVNEDFATIKLESKRSSGYNFIIDVYGYDEDELVENLPSDADDGYNNTEDDKEAEDKHKEDTATEDEDKEDHEKEPEKDGPKESFEEDKKEENPDEDKKEENPDEDKGEENPDKE